MFARTFSDALAGHWPHMRCWQSLEVLVRVADCGIIRSTVIGQSCFCQSLGYAELTIRTNTLGILSWQCCRIRAAWVYHSWGHVRIAPRWNTVSARFRIPVKLLSADILAVVIDCRGGYVGSSHQLPQPRIGSSGMQLSQTSPSKNPEQLAPMHVVGLTKQPAPT